jgi:hypothetical protein
MASSSGGQSRLFLVVVVALVGLLMIGLVSIAGLVVYTRFLAPTPSATVVAEATATPAPTATAQATAAASPVPTEEEPTPTRVIQEGSPTPGGPTPSPARATATPQGGGEMAPTGFGPLEAFLGGVALLIVILFVRRMRLGSGGR